jgi:DnaJ-class molecular chaperone
MSEAKDAWDRVGDSFGELGRSLKTHYDRTKDSKEATAEREAIERAVEAVREAASRAVDTVNHAVKDQEVRDGANQAVASLTDALGKSFGEVSQQVREALNRRDKGSGGA